ncbi:MAG: amidophosphoribosyltransferase [Methanomassiliicoccaceae archaeon]|nr:amidophosphoribosyltransferase [Methanomassiliicoccaceae archaeon]
MAGPKHSCGVVGMYCSEDVATGIFKALRMIQHRGQESAGISVFNGKRVITAKGPGLVHDAVKPNDLKALSGKCGIGHVRYPSAQNKADRNTEPIEVEISNGVIAIAHNGSITNYQELKKKYLDGLGWTFLTDSDSELISKIIAKHLIQNNDPIRSIRYTMSEIEGAYSLTILYNNRLFGVRDPYGFRPLCLGRIEDGYMLASESAAVDIFRGDFIRNITPGEIIEITEEGFKSYPSASLSQHRAHCMFEWIYFARPDSVIDGKEVYQVRRNVGDILAEEHPADVDLVMPVPDSGRAHALGYSIRSGIRYEEGFMKNRFVERTFILPDQKQREASVVMKLNPIRSTVKGKRILIVDDSIVRGTTLLKLIKMLRDAGAKEVHVRIGCPPIIAPCYYGVDMKSRDQFIALKHTVEEIRQQIGADSLGYTSVQGLVKAIGLPENDLCLACVNNKYPTKIHEEVHRFQARLKENY